jgi:hypothetical protein
MPVPYFSEFSRGGRLLFNAQFPSGVNSYWAYLLPWPQEPNPRARQSPDRAAHR